ncbi:MAG TPA: hypothetical protein VHW23_00040 [Kofleriaceae bacterium]|jgi:hypothetical protein|nr:hypothetical protein [Kofleriaceae bacterium]
MSAHPNILLLGFEPSAVPGVDASMVNTAIVIGQQRFQAAGLTAEMCLIKPDATAEPQIVAQLTAKTYACVVIGGGLRKSDEFVELLERVIHLVRQHAPDTPIAFNTNPTTSLDAVQRWLR